MCLYKKDYGYGQNVLISQMSGLIDPVSITRVLAI
jgi:hypothetical protein